MKILPVITVLLSAMLPTWSAGAQEADAMNASSANTGSSVEMEVTSVLQAERGGQLLLALSRARSAFEDYNDYTLARLTYGRLMVKSGDERGAITVLQPLVRSASSDWRPWFWLGTAYLIADDLDNAANALDEALAREGEQTAIWVQRAIVEQERGSPQTAVHYLQVANSISPDDLDVLINYAYAIELVGEYDKALLLYRHFLQRSVTSPEYGGLRSQILQRMHFIEQARRQLASAKTTLPAGKADSIDARESDSSDFEEDF